LNRTDNVFTQKVTTQEFVTQKNPPWGLARLSHREIDNSSYTYDSSAGEGIVAYSIDTGVYAEHADFEGRATMAKSFVQGEETDGNGHGTHTAGTFGGAKYGVAKKVTIVGVKVLSDEGSGSSSGIISGIEWAVNDMKKRGKARKAVANMSFGGPRTSNANNAAVKAATDAGMFVAVAAGNSKLLAELFTPASEPSACTVAASDASDQFASYVGPHPQRYTGQYMY
jgi:subtilisin family serine protease